MKLVEQELWQREEKGLIGILPVRDDADASAIGPVLSQGSCCLFYKPIRVKWLHFEWTLYYMKKFLFV